MFYLEIRSGLDAFQGCLSIDAVGTATEFAVVWDIASCLGHVFQVTQDQFIK